MYGIRKWISPYLEMRRICRYNTLVHRRIPSARRKRKWSCKMFRLTATATMIVLGSRLRRALAAGRRRARVRAVYCCCPWRGGYTCAHKRQRLISIIHFFSPLCSVQSLPYSSYRHVFTVHSTRTRMCVCMYVCLTQNIISIMI